MDRRAYASNGEFWWQRTLQVPFAAVAAVVLLILGMSFGLTVTIRSGEQAPPAPLSAGHVTSLDVESLEAFIRYIESYTTAEAVFKLPEASSFAVHGEPAFMRASEYWKGRE
jgi:hypothetical protein